MQLSREIEEATGNRKQDKHAEHAHHLLWACGGELCSEHAHRHAHVWGLPRGRACQTCPLLGPAKRMSMPNTPVFCFGPADRTSVLNLSFNLGLPRGPLSLSEIKYCGVMVGLRVITCSEHGTQWFNTNLASQQ